MNNIFISNILPVCSNSVFIIGFTDIFKSLYCDYANNVYYLACRLNGCSSKISRGGLDRLYY